MSIFSSFLPFLCKIPLECIDFGAISKNVFSPKMPLESIFGLGLGLGLGFEFGLELGSRRESEVGILIITGIGIHAKY